MQGHRERILVTGGAGFIGSHLVDRLLEDGYEDIIVLDDFSNGRFSNLESQIEDPRLAIIQGDIRDIETVRAALSGASLVYHLAARTASSDYAAELEDVFTTNVVGTFNVLRAASDLLARRIVFTSSCEAYGTPMSLPVDEDHPLLTGELNGASKATGETYCRAFRRVFGLQSAVLRLSTVYGPRDCTSEVSEWLGLALNGHEIVVPGEGRVADYVGIDLVVEALLQAARIDVALPPVNVASGTGTPVIDLARRISRLAGTRVRVRSLASDLHDAKRFVADVERMQRILGISAPMDPLDGLPDLLGGSALAAAV